MMALIGSFCTGNTSACAEKTTKTCIRHRGKRKHLRLRGENDLAQMPRLQREETPPLARRKRNAGAVWATPSGNTSACAEKTAFYASFGGWL